MLMMMERWWSDLISLYCVELMKNFYWLVWFIYGGGDYVLIMWWFYDLVGIIMWIVVVSCKGLYEGIMWRCLCEVMWSCRRCYGLNEYVRWSMMWYMCYFV